MERDRKQNRSGMRRRWSITTKVQEHINCEVTTIKVNVKPRGCLRFSVFHTPIRINVGCCFLTRFVDFLSSSTFLSVFDFSMANDRVDWCLMMRKFIFAAESAQFASQLESSLRCDGFMGLWKSAGRRCAVQGGHPVVGSQRRKCALFDLLHLFEGESE